MVTPVQLGLRGGRRVDHIYDFSGSLLAQESVPGQKVDLIPHWSQAKEALFSFFFPYLVHPQVWLHTVSERRVLF